MKAVYTVQVQDGKTNFLQQCRIHYRLKCGSSVWCESTTKRQRAIDARDELAKLHPKLNYFIAQMVK